MKSIPIIYVHGFIGHLRFPELATGLDSAAVWAPDLLGYGAYEDAALQDISIENQADHLAWWIESHAGSVPSILVGHSGGVAVVMRYAKKHASRVAAIISAEGNLAPSDAFLSSRLALMTPTDAVKASEPNRPKVRANAAKVFGPLL